MKVRLRYMWCISASTRTRQLHCISKSQVAEAVRRQHARRGGSRPTKGVDYSRNSMGGYTFL